MAAQSRGSVKVLVQPSEGVVGGDGDAVLLFTLGENLEQQFGAVAVQFHVSELVNAEEVDAAVAGDGLVQLLLVGCLDQLVHELGSQRVADAVALHGGLGGVGSLASQLARWGGATVIGTVRRTADLDRVDPAVAAHIVALDTEDPVGAIRAYAPEGVDRVVEVSLSDNADLDNAVTALGAVVAAYGTSAERTELPFWPLLFNNVTLRLLGSDDFPAEAKRQAARDLTSAAAVGALTVHVGDRYPLQDIAEAHDRVDAGTRGRVLVTIDDGAL